MYFVAAVLAVLSGLFYAAGHHQISRFARRSPCASMVASSATVRCSCWSARGSSAAWRACSSARSLITSRFADDRIVPLSWTMRRFNPGTCVEMQSHELPSIAVCSGSPARPALGRAERAQSMPWARSATTLRQPHAPPPCRRIIGGCRRLQLRLTPPDRGRRSSMPSTPRIATTDAASSGVPAVPISMPGRTAFRHPARVHCHDRLLHGDKPRPARRFPHSTQKERLVGGTNPWLRHCYDVWPSPAVHNGACRG